MLKNGKLKLHLTSYYFSTMNIDIWLILFIYFIFIILKEYVKFSDAAYKEFALWQAYDDAQDNFCNLPDDDGAAEYVDLLLNPERYTGYRGKSAHRIWRSIYRENCFG